MEDRQILEAMSRYGGSFVQALARAAERADPVNLGKLRAAFPDVWQEYARLASQDARTRDRG
jgi:hypothetical protein